MGTLLFLLLFFFVLLPLGRIAWAAWQQYRLLKRHMRRAQEFQDSFRRARQEAGGESDERPRHSRTRKKKIARDVGEYVAFEEMRTYSDPDTADTPPPTPPAGSQIEDADWEDIR